MTPADVIERFAKADPRLLGWIWARGEDRGGYVGAPIDLPPTFRRLRALVVRAAGVGAIGFVYRAESWRTLDIYPVYTLDEGREVLAGVRRIKAGGHIDALKLDPGEDIQAAAGRTLNRLLSAHVGLQLKPTDIVVHIPPFRLPAPAVPVQRVGAKPNITWKKSEERHYGVAWFNTGPPDWPAVRVHQDRPKVDLWSVTGAQGPDDAIQEVAKSIRGLRNAKIAAENWIAALPQ